MHQLPEFVEWMINSLKVYPDDWKLEGTYITHIPTERMFYIGSRPHDDLYIGSYRDGRRIGNYFSRKKLRKAIDLWEFNQLKNKINK